ncbi:hypothetical protein [Endozoicomonas sp. 8E]|uniref:hypothetical protein n=1 Tax=Endozoicomonas sp. 8E TaxID=3035692 RepID=UPI002938FEEC|nr:hypothetical protein [Endozoicomonas sp. 8E]WOG29128.1 hypothetical protein P6910_05540 [Endozoicomonas sp. 8E]
MHAAQGTGTSASLCPTPQTEFDTQSVTASGHWTVCESTSKLIPCHPAEPERQALLQAAASGQLAFRRIELTKEENYFSGKGAPRPFTLALPGEMMPTGRVPEDYGKWMLGIADPKCLYAYKRNAGTRRLLIEPDLTPETLSVKLLPHLQSLLNRRLERGNQVVWRVYPLRFTSGHLQADGTFSLPKLKSDHSARPLDYPELVLSKYDKEDIKCFFVYKDAQTNIADILWDKRQCEKALKIKKMPLVVYCHRTGSIQVCFDDELDSEHLARNEHYLNDFAFAQGIAPTHFRAMLNLLPMSLRAKTLSSTLTVSPDVMGKLQQAIKLVSNPRLYSYEKFLKLKQSGLPVHQSFFHEGDVRSLLDMLLASEKSRNNQPQHEQTRKHEREACRLLELLLQSGARLGSAISHIYAMADTTKQVIPASTMNYMVAAFGPFDFLTLKHLSRMPLTGCPASVVEFDRICRGHSQEKLQQCMKEIIFSLFFNTASPDVPKTHLLALFHYFTDLDPETLHSVKRTLDCHYPGAEMVNDDFSTADCIQWVEELWQQRKTIPFYRYWSEHVRQAQQDIKVLKQSLGLDDSHRLATPLATETPTALKFVVDAFSTPPVLPDNVGDNEKTILKILQHYYRRPGPERVIQCLGRPIMPTVWKPQHSCSHILRARNNGHWYMELLEKFQLCSLSPDEKELLSLAIIYHDVAAEDVDKSAEESKSAEYFRRDLTGRYSVQLLDDMEQAMTSKENDVKGKDQQNLPDPLRWYLRILRFADRMDVIRGCGVDTDFPGLTVTQSPGFDARRLDIPLQLTSQFTSESGNKTEFQRHLEAAMHGAADLARVTGRLRDQRKKNYTQVYGLNDNGSKISENFEWTTEPVQRMNQFIDDNVRRKMAQLAGIIVCSDPGHQACKADQSKGITYGIHNSWYDLRQVTIPAAMTLLEKMQYEHDPSLLSPATQQAIEQEVQRLKSEGIRMNTGTLTQKTLDSEKAREVLRERGINVFSEPRPYFTNDGFPKERKMLVPEKK